MGLLDELRNAGQGASRTFWAGGLGGPADLATLLANTAIAAGGYVAHKAGLVNSPPDLLGPSPFGSERIADRMRSAGLLNDLPGSAGDRIGEAAGVLLPLLAQTKAPQIAGGLLQAINNAATPRLLGTQRGAIAVKTNAISEPVYHGTRKEFDSFDFGRAGENTAGLDKRAGVMFTDSADEAAYYTQKIDPNTWVERLGSQPRVIEARLDSRKPLVVRTSENPTNYFDSNVTALVDKAKRGNYDVIVVKGDGPSIYAVQRGGVIRQVASRPIAGN